MLTGAERRRVAAGLRQRYGAGASVRRLAATTGYSYNKVWRLLNLAGTVMRPVGKSDWADAERDQLAAALRQRYEGGESIRQIAAGAGIGYGRVRRLLLAAGTTLRGHGARKGRTR